MMRQSARYEPGSSATWAAGLLRALREAAGITQEGWAARLGYGRRTVQRWERGDGLPDAAATEVIIHLCGELRLFRPFTAGVLAGITLSPAWLRDALTDARQSRRWPDGPSPRRDNLPAESTSFIGREEAVVQLTDRLTESRLLTLIGPGGVGKTRLALRVAAGMAASRDGTWLVELATIADGAQVAPAVAVAMGLPARPGYPWLVALREAIADRPVLLVLDNCEHLLDACANLAAELLGACPALTILATSRAPLDAPGEALWPVTPLALPGEDVAPATLVRCESVRLFVDRASAMRPGFALRPSNAGAVARICSRLDGLPLAIELAAARVRVLTAPEIATRLDDRFTFLAAGSATVARHHTLRAAIAWSYDLLDEAERRLFDRLSVFPGGFTLAGVEAVCGGVGGQVLDVLLRLVDRSLVMAEPMEPDGDTVYRLLETLRLFAAEKLDARGEAGAVAADYAAWVKAFATAGRAAIHGPDQVRWFRVFARHRADVLAAMRWVIDHGDATTALRLACAVSWPWGALGWGVESAALLERALAMPADSAAAPERAAALAELASVALFLGRYDVARASLAEIAAIGDAGAATRLSVQATEARSCFIRNEIGPAEELARRGLDDARLSGNVWYEGRFLAFLALAALRRGKGEDAEALLTESLALARLAEDDWSLATALVELGDAARANGDSDRAMRCYRESLAVRRRLGVLGATASLWHNLGYAALAHGDVSAAAESFRMAEREFSRWGDQRGMAECVIGLGALMVARGEFDIATRLLSAGNAVLQALGSSIWPSNQADVDHALTLCRDELTPDTFAAAWDAGRALTLDAAWALGAAPRSDRSRFIPE